MERSVARTCRAWLAAIVAAAACTPRDGPPSTHRLRAAPAASDRLVADGARVVADYGSFRVLDVRGDALPAALAMDGVELRDDYRVVFLNSARIDTRAAARARPGAPPAGERALHLVQLAGPPRDASLARIRATGARIVSYVPQNAYLLYGDAEAFRRVGDLERTGEIAWRAAYAADDKLPRAPPVDRGLQRVQLVDDPHANAETLAALADVEVPGTRARALGYVNVVVRADRGRAREIAALPDVVSVLPWTEPRLLDERQDLVLAGQVVGGGPGPPGYLAWLAAHGFTQEQFDASGIGVDVSDDGIDDGTIQPNHFGLYRQGDVGGASRVAYARLVGVDRGLGTAGCAGHGTLNAHVVAGWSDRDAPPFTDSAGYRYGLGVAPFARLGSSVVFDAQGFTYPVYEDLTARAWADGMSVSSNSWGTVDGNWYDADAQRYDALVRDAAPPGSAAPVDGNQPLVIVFSAGNDGPTESTVHPPGTAKNVITVGASEGVQPFGGADRCAVADVHADAALDLAFFSSRGPTLDRRVKPDLVAPGTHVTGGVPQAEGQRAEPPASAYGAALACFDATGVCGGVTDAFFPPGQQWYTASSGTSHAAPAVAGAAALVRQRFVNEGRPPPSPAMTKALLLASARYMTGAGAGDDRFSSAQGMGLLDLAEAFSGAPALLRDQEPEDLFTATGQVRTFEASVGGGAVRVTLAWTDAPGPTFGDAACNDLDLSVTVNGVTYRGNVFSGGVSVPGGAADPRNNVESVVLPEGITGPVTVTVTAASVNSDGVPGNATPADQDFALVVTPVCAGTAPVAPSGVTASASADNEITVSWSDVAADGFTISRAVSADGPFVPVAEVAAPPWIDARRSGGTTYFYEVRARRGCAYSAAGRAAATATGGCMLAPSFAGLASADPTGDAVCGVALAWAPARPSCGGAIRYDVHRATTSGFTPGPENRIAAGLSGLGHVDVGGLTGGASYFYVVRAVESGPVAQVDDGGRVERAAAPSWRQVVFEDDLDGRRSAAADAFWWWEVIAGGEAVSRVSGCRFQSPVTAWRLGAPGTACGGTYPADTWVRLVLGGDGTSGANGIEVPPGGGTLSFRLWYRLESYFDSAVLLYSTTGPLGPFKRVPDSLLAGAPLIAAGRYDGAVRVGGRGWTGAATPANGAFKEVVVDLAPLAGQRAWFAWQVQTDDVLSYEGVYVDDVRITGSSSSCAPTPPPPTAAAFRIEGLPATLQADVPVEVVLTAVDGAGAIAPGYGGALRLFSTDPQAVLPGDVALAGGTGRATVRLRTQGAQVLHAIDLSTGAATGSASTEVLAGAPVALRFHRGPGTIVAGRPFAPEIAVALQDAWGNIGGDAVVSLAVGPSGTGASIVGDAAAAAAAGVATFPAVSVERAGTGYVLLARAPGLTTASSGAFDVLAGPPAALAFVAGPADVVAGETIAPAVRVAVLDAFGNPTADATHVALALSSADGASLAGTTAAGTNDGVATFGDLRVERAGTGRRLVASSDGLLGASSSEFAVLAAAPHSVAFVQPPGDVEAGLPFEPLVTARLADRFGNTAAGWAWTVSVSLSGGPAGAALRGTSSAIAADGVAAFPELAIERAGDGYALALSADGIADGATSGPFSVRAGPAAACALSGPASATAGAAATFAAVARDAFGNGAVGFDAAVPLASTDAAAELPAEVTFTAGAGGPFAVVFRTAGAQTVSLSGPGWTCSRAVEVQGQTPAAEPGGSGCGCGATGAADPIAIALVLLVAARVGPRRSRGRPETRNGMRRMRSSDA